MADGYHKIETFLRNGKYSACVKVKDDILAIAKKRQGVVMFDDNGAYLVVEVSKVFGGGGLLWDVVNYLDNEGHLD